jgi:glutathione peroxidase
MNIYEFKIKSMDGQEKTLIEYDGFISLIVNTASKSEFTHQLEDLEMLYKKYKNEKFVVLGFPCNGFANQDPESNDKILEFCQTNYGVTFPMFAKIDVNGDNADNLFKYLVLQHEFKGFNFSHPLGKKLDDILSRENKEYALSGSIKWNFTKFLIDRDGNCIERFEPTTDIEEIEDYIKPLF